MIIRDETSHDARAIRSMTETAFALKAYSDGTEGAVIDALREVGALTLSLVAVEGDGLWGHIAFSPVAVGAVDRGWYGLGPISVDTPQQRKGIGSTLMREGLRRMRALGALGVVLIGDPKYYSRFGFSTEMGLTYQGLPSKNVMGLSFSTELSGEIRFHSAFG